MTLHKHWAGNTLFLPFALILYIAFLIDLPGFVYSISVSEWNGVTARRFLGVQH